MVFFFLILQSNLISHMQFMFFNHTCMAEILLFLLIYIYLLLVMLCFVSSIYVLYVTEINMCVLKMSQFKLNI